MRVIFLPQVIYFELIMRGNSASHYVDRPRFLGYKITPKNLNPMGISFQRGNFRIAPQNGFESIG